MKGIFNEDKEISFYFFVSKKYDMYKEKCNNPYYMHHKSDNESIPFEPVYSTFTSISQLKREFCFFYLWKIELTVCLKGDLKFFVS